MYGRKLFLNGSNKFLFILNFRGVQEKGIIATRILNRQIEFILIEILRNIGRNFVIIKTNITYKVTHKGWDCKDDLKLLKYPDFKVNLSLLP